MSDQEIRVKLQPDPVLKAALGLPGPPGPPGVNTASSVIKTAKVALGGHRVVIASQGQADYADCGVPAHADSILGLTLAAAAAGTPVTVVRGGEVTEPSWTWAPGPVFLAHNGLLTQTPPSDAAFLLVVGFSDTPQTLYVALREPITLQG